MEYPKSIIEQVLAEGAGVIVFEPPYLACAGHVPGHTDDCFDPWSAFLVLRNDGCRVWQRCGWTGTPMPGERFELNIHKQHGVRAKPKQFLVVLCADGKTREEAMAKLDETILTLRDDTEQQEPLKRDARLTVSLDR